MIFDDSNKCLQGNKQNDEQIAKIRSELDRLYKRVNFYGDEIANNISMVVSTFLNFGVKETSINSDLADLMNRISKSIHYESKQLLKLNKSILKTAECIDKIISSYSDISSVIFEFKNLLSKSIFSTKRDNNVAIEYLEHLTKYIYKLDCYIEVGADRLHNTNSRDDKDYINKLSDRINELKVLKVKSNQYLHHIKLYIETNNIVINKMQSLLNIIVPLWEENMLLAVNILKQNNMKCIVKHKIDTMNLLSINKDFIEHLNLLIKGDKT